MKNKKVLAASLAGVLAVLAVVYAVQLLMRPPVQQGKLYRFYPVDAGFYLELQPGERLAHRFIAFLDRQSASQEAMRNAVIAQQIVQREAEHRRLKAMSKQPSEAETQELTRKKALLADHERHRRFRQAFLDKYHSLFKPYFSLGAWQPARTGAQPNPPKPGHGDVLIVFPLKSAKQDLNGLMATFGLKDEDFEQKQFAPDISRPAIPYRIEKNSRTAAAVVEGHLFVTNTPEAMTAALAHYWQGGPTIYDDPLNKKLLGKLSRGREGTFILNNRPYAQDAIESQKKQGKKPLFVDLVRIMPVTVGAIEADRPGYLSVQFQTPMLVSEIQNSGLRRHLTDILRARAPLSAAKRLPADTAMFLSVSGLDEIYDLLVAHWLSPEEARNLFGIQALLAAGAHIDLRQDIVGLFSEQTVLAGRPRSQSMMVLLDKTDRKKAVLDKLNQALDGAPTGLRPKTSVIHDVTVRTLALPGAAGRMGAFSYGELPDAIVLAPEADLKETLALMAKPEHTLAQTPGFKPLMRDIPRQGNLLLYVNLEEQLRAALSRMQAHGMALPVEGPAVHALVLGVWTHPEQPGAMELIQGQLNMKLAPPPPPPPASPNSR